MINLQKFNNDWSFRHFNKKWDGSLTWMRISIAENKNKEGETIMFLTALSFNWPKKWDKLKESFSAVVSQEALQELNNAIQATLGYQEAKEEYIITNNASAQINAVVNNKALIVTYKDKKSETEVTFDFGYLEILKLQRQIRIMNDISNNIWILSTLDSVQNAIVQLWVEQEWIDIFWNNGSKKKILPTTIEHSSINLKDKQPVGSHLNFRNGLLNQEIESEDSLSKYPITLVTQEAWYSFATTIEPEIQIALEKYLKAFSVKWVNKASKFLSDKEEQLMKDANILSVYNNKGTDMHQFKIYSETWTIQYSINSKDKSLTVSRIWVATVDDVDRARSSVLKLRNLILAGEGEPSEIMKLKHKYDKLVEFWKKLSESSKSRKPYFTSYIKVEDPQALIFKINLTNSYFNSPVKSEKEKTATALTNLQVALDSWKVNKEDTKLITDEVKNIVDSKIFFKKDFKFDNGKVILSYDARHAPLLMRDKEDRSHKTFKFLFSNDGKDNGMLLGLGDIKQFIDNKGVFTKEIDYELDGKQIKKKFSINEDGTYVYEDTENTFSGKIKLEDLDKSIDVLKKEVIENDLRKGGFYDKIMAYETYKIDNFWIEKPKSNIKRNKLK